MHGLDPCIRRDGNEISHEWSALLDPVRRGAHLRASPPGCPAQGRARRRLRTGCRARSARRIGGSPATSRRGRAKPGICSRAGSPVGRPAISCARRTQAGPDRPSSKARPQTEASAALNGDCVSCPRIAMSPNRPESPQSVCFRRWPLRSISGHSTKALERVKSTIPHRNRPPPA
jgi:hypothetical protein